jgi:predicted 2-oxoglutarate/Fe(II)-dependent dioxygenase YbiX
VGRPIERGERAPDFVLPLLDEKPTRFYGIAGGRPTILVFSEAAIEIARSAVGVDVFLILRTAIGAKDRTAFVDAEGKAFALYGAVSGTVLILDPNLRVLDRAAGVDDAFAKISASDPAEGLDAPVLPVPRVLDLDDCARLIDLFEARGGVETGVERSKDGRREDAIDPYLKQRRDITIGDPALVQELTRKVGRRVIPEVERSFAYKATCFEGFKIARYDASDGGHFRAHRDNLSPSTAHRRFALTLNLNDDYEGGQLAFPEFGTGLHRPRAGGAVIFSCAFLHEAKPVTRGSRYVLLSFLFDDPESRRIK